MIQFVCDWCQAVKERGECWILGMGVEQVALTAARREIAILPAWEDSRAVHPLAVHFCCEDHKDQYVAAMFDTKPAPVEMVVETEVARTPVQTTRVVRTGAATKPKKTAGRKPRSSRRRAA